MAQPPAAGFATQNWPPAYLGLDNYEKTMECFTFAKRIAQGGRPALWNGNARRFDLYGRIGRLAAYLLTHPPK